MKQSEIKELSTSGITEKIAEEQATLVKIKMGHKVSPIENPLKIRTTRRTVARLKTELKQRQKAEAKK